MVIIKCINNEVVSLRHNGISRILKNLLNFNLVAWVSLQETSRLAVSVNPALSTFMRWNFIFVFIS